MKKIPLEELPRWSNWPERLLNLAEFRATPRTIDKIEKEYNQDKYAKCLQEFHRVQGRATPEQIKQFEFGLPPDHLMCVSLQDELYAMSLQEARDTSYRLLTETVGSKLKEARTVIELGAGYGFNLWMLKQRFPETHFVGGEFSENAVQLASLLYAGLPSPEQVCVTRFNFYDEDCYRLVEERPGPVIVFTSHAVEQCPSAEVIVRNLLHFRDQLIAVFHFEPVRELAGDSLLGLLRQRYSEINDYNRDLLTLLRANPAIRLNSVKANVFGLNPLNPTSILKWEPVT